MDNQYNAFADTNVIREPVENGALDGFTYAVKDVIAIKGHINTAGNPDWHRTHKPAEQTAPVIELLQSNGAKLTGTTHTDELMYSLNGENFHYGTPVNPKTPDSIPGGSSSGSAVAVAAGQVDFSLGTDTGGSVRIPSSYCGIYGIRPTHGVVPMEGVIPLASSFDTVGWMAGNAKLLQKVGEVLLADRAGSNPADFSRLILPKEAWALLDVEVSQKLSAFLPLIEKVVSKLERISISEEGLAEWADTFRILQGLEIHAAHGDWIAAENPAFGPGIAERFAWTSTLKKEDYEEQVILREKIQNNLTEIIKEDGVFVLPTAPGAAPQLQLPAEALEERRKKTMQLSCIAGLTGFPQISIPAGVINGKPIGLSIIAGRNQDKKLLSLVAAIEHELSISQSVL